MSVESRGWRVTSAVTRAVTNRAAAGRRHGVAGSIGLPTVNVARTGESARPGARLGRLPAVGCTCSLVHLFACSCLQQCHACRTAARCGGGVFCCEDSLECGRSRVFFFFVDAAMHLCFTQRGVCRALTPCLSICIVSQSRLALRKASDMKGSLPDLRMGRGTWYQYYVLCTW